MVTPRIVFGALRGGLLAVDRFPAWLDEAFFFSSRRRHTRYWRDRSSDVCSSDLDVLGSGTVLWARRLELVDTHAVHAQAVEPSVVAFMRREDLDRFILKNPEVGLRMMDLLAERLGSSNERMAEVAHKDVVSRLASQILRLLESEGVVDPEGYKLPAAYTHEELGTMIGAGRVAVSRALKDLREAGAVQTGRTTVHVRDTEILERIARAEG